MNETYKIYCLSYNNPSRKESMIHRLDKLDINYIIYDGVGPTDERIHPECYKQCWSCMYGHLDMIKMFYEDPSVNFGVFCEDDIYIRKDFKDLMPNVINEFKHLNLDVLLLGYLVPFKVEPHHSGFHIKDIKYVFADFRYHNYYDDVWGTQMYMISKENARKLLEKYDEHNGYALRSLNNKEMTPFSADWTITKDGNRALISPCLATENGLTETEHEGQRNFHKACNRAHYNEELFI